MQSKSLAVNGKEEVEKESSYYTISNQTLLTLSTLGLSRLCYNDQLDRKIIFIVFQVLECLQFQIHHFYHCCYIVKYPFMLLMAFTIFSEAEGS